MNTAVKNRFNFKILIVEDEPDNNEFLAELLSLSGYEVDQAFDGEQGLAKVEEFEPDLVLLDIMMPKIDGLEFCKRIRAKQDYRNLKIIFITARGNLEEKINGFNAGADDFLSKPFAPSELLARINAQLRIVELSAQLSASERRHRNLIENMPDGLMLVSEDFKLEFFNPRCSELLHVELKEEYLNKNLRDAIKHSYYCDEICNLINSASKIMTESNFMKTVALPNENYPEILEIRVISPEVYDSKREYAQIILRDVTDKYNMERLFVQTEKNNSLGIMIAGISHEINNPLAGISNAIHLMKKGKYDEKRQLEVCDMMLENVNRISRIIDDLRTFGHLERVDNGEFLIIPVVKEAIRLIDYQRQDDNTEITFVHEDCSCKVMGSKTQFLQLVMNILLNALKAVDKKGKINVSLSKTNSLVPSAVLTIEDNGCGIPENQINQIFDPFFAAKREWQGTGLGLAVSYRIVQLLKGTIKVASKLGVGSKFTVTVPIV